MGGAEGRNSEEVYMGGKTKEQTSGMMGAWIDELMHELMDGFNEMCIL